MEIVPHGPSNSKFEPVTFYLQVQGSIRTATYAPSFKLSFVLVEAEELQLLFLSLLEGTVWLKGLDAYF